MTVVRPKKRAPYLMKSDVCRLAAEKCGFYIKDVNIVVDAFIEAMIETFEQEKAVEIRGFGLFRYHYRPPGPIWDPKAKIMRPNQGKRFVRFKSSRGLNRKLAGLE